MRRPRRAPGKRNALRFEPLEDRRLLAVSTELLQDVNAVDIWFRARGAQVNGKIVYIAADVGHGQELWITDGTQAGTGLLKDVNPGPASSRPGEFIEFGDLAVFAAADGVHGRELWITDGTSEGTHSLKDQTSDQTIPSSVWHYYANGEQLLLSLRGSLWSTDGTGAGTQLIKSFSSDDAISQIIVSGGVAYLNVGGLTNAGLWTTDGTDAGTVEIGDLRPSNLTDVNGTLLNGTKLSP